MAATDPRTTLRTNIVGVIAAITKDDGVTPASTIHIWEDGPETLKNLFYTDNYDIVFTYGEPRSRGVRELQDVPVHYNMDYPITVSTVDKPLTGVLVCTGARMQYKALYALRLAVAAIAQSVPAASPAYTATLITDSGTVKRVGGIMVWESVNTVIYETDYA